MHGPDAELASAKDIRLRIERVAIRGLDKLSRRLGLALGLLMGIIGLAVVYELKGIPLTHPWWVFQLGQTEYFVDTRTIWFQMRWIAPLVLGALASYLSMTELAKAVSERSLRGAWVSRIGLLVSVAALTVLELDSFRVINIGSPTSQVWLYPVSLVGISFAMISLAMSREGGARDERLSVLAALVPLALLTFPAVMSFHEPALSDVVLAVYLWSAVAYMLSGMKLDTLYQSLTFDRLAKWAAASLAFVLVLVGAITNGPRSFFVELRWVGVASAGLALAMLVVWMIRRPNAANPARKDEGGSGLEVPIASLGLLASLALLALFLLDSTGALSLHAPDWFFPASIIGAALAMISLTVLGTGNHWDKAVSYCAIAASAVVLGLPVIRQVNPEWAGYSLGVLGIIVLVLRFQSEPTLIIPVKRLAERRRLLDALGIAGPVASAALLVLFVLNQTGSISFNGSFIEGSLIITALTMLVLLLTRTARFWEKVATIGLVGAALFTASLSGITRWDPAAHPGTIISLYTGSAILLLISGIRPVTMYMNATVLREKAKLAISRWWKVTRQVMKNPMGVVGTLILLSFVVLAAFGPELAPYRIPSGAGHPGIDQWEKYLQPSETLIPAPSYIVDVVWGIPLVAAVLASSAVLGLGRRSTATGAGARSPLAAAALFLSAGLLSLVILDALNIMELGRPDWLYPASAAAAFLVMLASAVSENRLGRKGLVGLGLIAGALVLVLVPLFMGSSLATRAQELFATYLGAGVLTVAAGLAIHSSIKESSGWVGGAVPSSARMVKAFGIGFAAAFIIAGIVAILEGNWTAHWMGTDTFGYDTFSELLYGARTSIIVGIISALIASVLGALVGLYSGYVGGWADEVIMRMNDVVLSIPWLVLMIIVAAMIGTIDLTGIILIIGLTGWSTTARMVRAQVLSIRERQYIERARAIGSPDLAIIRRHVLPNAFPLVFANTILTVAVSILSEATLSFLGMRPVGVVTWGTMLSYASSANAFAIGLHWWIIAPGLCIVVIVLGFTLLGYALDDVLNPKLRKR